MHFDSVCVCLGGGGVIRQREKKGADVSRVKDVQHNVTGLLAGPPLGIMINAVGAVARRMPSAARRSGCWIACCQAVLLGASALVIVAERSARKWARNSPAPAGCWFAAGCLHLGSGNRKGRNVCRGVFWLRYEWRKHVDITAMLRAGAFP